MRFYCYICFSSAMLSTAGMNLVNGSITIKLGDSCIKTGVTPTAGIS